MRRPGERVQHADSGAALLLAVGFVLMFGAISGGLASLAANSVNNRNTLEILRNREYSADGAIENAISQARLRGACLPASGTIVDATMNSVSIRVDWVESCPSVLSSNSTPFAQRNVVFLACLNTGPSCLATDVITRAQVNFEPANLPATKTFVQSWNVRR